MRERIAAVAQLSWALVGPSKNKKVEFWVTLEQDLLIKNNL